MVAFVPRLIQDEHFVTDRVFFFMRYGIPEVQAGAVNAYDTSAFEPVSGILETVRYGWETVFKGLVYAWAQVLDENIGSIAGSIDVCVAVFKFKADPAGISSRALLYCVGRCR